MLYAESESGERILAAKGLAARCPSCNGDVRAKCGSIVTHHWAHVASDCDPWSEPESEWHRKWKSHFPPECCEVVIGHHRADVKISGTVIEFQNSPISPEEIAERETFYGDMIWVLNGDDFFSRLRFIDGAEIKKTWWCRDNNRAAILAFHWSHARKSWAAARRPVFIHFELNDNGTQMEFLFEVTQFPCPHALRSMKEEDRTFVPSDSMRHKYTGRYGTGRVWSKQDFLARQLAGGLRDWGPARNVWNCSICRAAAMVRNHVRLLVGQSDRAMYGAGAGERWLAKVFESIVCIHVRSSVFYHDRDCDSPLSMPIKSWRWLVESVIQESVNDGILCLLMEGKDWNSSSFGSMDSRKRWMIQSMAAKVVRDLAGSNSIETSDYESKSVKRICGCHYPTHEAVITDDGVAIVPIQGKEAHVSQTA